jgi:hypothetical protein
MTIEEAIQYFRNMTDDELADFLDTITDCCEKSEVEWQEEEGADDAAD